MKILKNGTVPKVDTLLYRGTCNNCQCQVEVEKSETVASYISGCPEQMRFVECPTVGCENTALYVKEHITR